MHAARGGEGDKSAAVDAAALAARLEQLEMTEVDNSELREQLDDLSRELECAREEADRVRGEVVEMAELENSSLRLRIDLLEREVASRRDEQDAEAWQRGIGWTSDQQRLRMHSTFMCGTRVHVDSGNDWNTAMPCRLSF